MLARAGLDPSSPAGAMTWLVLSAVAIAVACLAMRRAFAASADAWALSLNALAGLLISPISWSHHWVWGETTVLTLAILSWRGRARDCRRDAAVHRGRSGRPHGAGPMRGRLWLAIAAAGAVMFAVSPQWWFPSGGNRELHWTAWEQAVGSSYVIFAAVVLLAAACLPAPAAGQVLACADAEPLPRALAGAAVTTSANAAGGPYRTFPCLRLRSHSTRSPSPRRWACSRRSR